MWKTIHHVGVSKLLALTAATAIRYRPGMAVLTIRDLDDAVRDQLRVRAATHGRSMEAEVRAILADAVQANDRSVQQAMAAFRKATGGIDLVWSRPHDEPRDPFA
jgi:plasmid stability protein